MLNLGDINFGIDVDTSPLVASVQKVMDFGAAVEKAARMTGDGAQAAAAALRQQEQAALNALQQTLNFQQRVYRVGGPQTAIDNSSAAYSTLVNELTNVNQSTLGAQRAMSLFRAEMGAARRETIDFVDAQASGTAESAAFFSETQAGSARLMRLQSDLMKLTDTESKFFSETQSGSAKLITLQRNLQNLGESANVAGSDEVKFFSETQAGSAKLMALNANLSKLTAEQEIAGSATNRFSVLLRDVSGAATLTFGPLSGFGARVMALSSILNRQNLAIAGLVSGFALVTVAAGALSKSAIDSAVALNVVQQRFESISGSASFTAAELEHLHNISMRLGVSFLGTADEFSKFIVAARVAGFTIQGATDVFDGFMTVAAKMHLPGEEITRVMQTLERMMSTNIVNAMELKRQLAVALPGAYTQAAKAMGYATGNMDAFNKALKSGTITAQELLPALTKVLLQYHHLTSGQSVTSLVASQGRFKNSVVDLGRAFDNIFHISEAYKASLDGMTKTFEDIAAHTRTLEAAFGALGAAIAAAFAPAIIGMIGSTISSLIDLTTAVWGEVSAFSALATEVGIFDVAINAIPGEALIAVFLRIAAAVLGAAAGYEVLHHVLGVGDTKLQNSITTLDAYVKALNTAKDAASGLTHTKIREAQADVQEVQKQVAADKERIASLEQIRQQVLKTGGMEMVAGWSATDNAIKTATAALQKHEGTLKGLKHDLDALTTAYNKQLAAEKAAQNQQTQDAVSAKDSLTLYLSKLVQLHNASYSTASALSMLQQRFADFNPNSGALAGFEKQLIAAKVVTQKQILEINNLVRGALEHGQRPTSSLILSKVQLSPEGVNAVKTFFNDIQGKPELMANITTQFDSFDRVILQTNQALAQDAAARKYGDAIGAVTSAFRDQQQIDSFSKAIIKQKGDTEQARAAIEAYKHSLAETGKVKTVAAFADIKRQTQEIQQAVALIHHGGGIEQLKQLQAEQRYHDNIQKTTKALMDKASIMAEVIKLEGQGYNSTEAIAKAEALLAANALKVATANAAAKLSFQELLKELKANSQGWDQMQKTVTQASDNMASQLASQIAHMQFSLSSLLQTVENVIQQMLEKFIQTKFTDPFFAALFGSGNPTGGSGTGSGGGGLLGGVVGGITSFIKGLAVGGPANVNTPYIVGENGPELFVPGVSGTVIPNDQLGGFNSERLQSYGAAQAGGGRVHIHLEMQTTPEFHAQISKTQAQTAQAVMITYDQKVLPTRVAHLTADPRLR